MVVLVLFVLILEAWLACYDARHESPRLGIFWLVLKSRVQFRVLFIRVPFYIGDLNRTPHLENYPYGFGECGVQCVSAVSPP